MVSTTRWSVIRAAQRGDSDALECLCSKYRPAVVAYLRRCDLGEEAEDVAQEVLMALVQTLSKAHATAGRFRALVFAVARHKHLSFRERRGAAKRGGDHAIAALDPDTLAAQGEPDDLFDREWLASLLKTCLERLRTEQPTLYAALKGTVLSERPQAQVAREEGVSAATIRKRVWRGRKQIGSYLRELVEIYALSRDDLTQELRYLTKLLGPLGESDGPKPPG